MQIQNEKTYDSVFWTSVVKMTKFLIPLVNEAFGEHYSENATIRLEAGKQIVEHTDGSLDHGEMDALAELTENGTTKDYHIEVETWSDKTFAVRIAEYAAGKAYDSIKLTEKGAEMTIPYSAVIFLRAGDEIPNEFLIDIKSPGGTISYTAPVVKVRNYSISELFEKRLLLLLPFYGFNFDEKFAEMEEVGIDELRLALDEINRRLSGLVEKHELDESERNHLIDWIKRVLDKLTVNYRNVTKGVDELMGGYILHTRTDDILDEGRMEGRIEGRIEGVQVINYLWEHNRGEDAKRAANDKEYLNQLMAEIGAEVLAK